MNKKMRVLFILNALLIFIFAIAGCGTSGGGSGENQGDFQPHVGYESLDMQFSSGSPPTTIYSNQRTIPMLLELRNKGAYEMTGGTIYLSGFDKSILHLDKESFSVGKLDPVTTINQEGGFRIENIVITSITMPEGLDRYTPTLMLTACYPYKTEASVMICVDPEPYKGVAADKTCRPGVVSVGAGQGAPIAIASIDQEIIPKEKMLFRIRLVNSGGGDVVTTTTCNRPLEYNEVDIMPVNAGNIKISGLSVNTVQPTELKFTNNAATIYVESSIPSTGTEYLAAMSVNLQYFYRKTYSRRLEIRNAQSSY